MLWIPFFSEAASYAPQIVEGAFAGDGEILRIVHARSPLGEEKEERIVRIPLFFSEGEVAGIDQLRLVLEGNGKEVLTQFDKVRLGPDGGLARCELYAKIGFAGKDEVRLELRRSEKGSKAAEKKAHDFKVSRNSVQLSNGRGQMEVSLRGSTAGKVLNWGIGKRRINFGDEGAGPAGKFLLQDQDCNELGSQRLEAAEKVEVAHGTGPLFSKIVVRYQLERLKAYAVYEYLIFGDEDRVQQSYYTGRVKPEKPGTVTIDDHKLLGGSMAGGLNFKEEAVPVGLRKDIPFPHEHAGQALREAREDWVLYPVPHVQFAIESVTFEDRQIEVKARPQTRRKDGGSWSQKGVWGACDYLFLEADESRLWEAGLKSLNPPVAIVEDPKIGKDAFVEMLHELLAGLKPVGREPKLVKPLLHANPNEKRIEDWLRNSVGEDLRETAKNWADDAKQVHQRKVESLGRPLKEFEKGKAYGLLDPYHITYQTTVVGALAADSSSPIYDEAVDYSNAVGRAVMEAAGMRSEKGETYINTFYSAFNMQAGPLMLGVIGATKRGDGEVLKFYKDLANSEGVRGLYGKGQRSYGSLIAKPGPSDILYMELSDFFLRSAELISGTDLGCHPAAFARYGHCLTVDADLLQTNWVDPGNRAKVNDRAVMFRGQHHDHRWEGWDTSPYMALIWPGKEWEAGYTEACYFLNRLKGKWQNWPNFSFLFTLHQLALAELPAD